MQHVQAHLKVGDHIDAVRIAIERREHEGIGAAATAELVIAVAAEQYVVAGAAGDLVVASPAIDRIVAGIAVDGVVSAGPDQPVVAGCALDHRHDTLPLPDPRTTHSPGSSWRENAGELGRSLFPRGQRRSAVS